MQETMTSNARVPSLLQFARRGYMVRSEKRPGPAPRQTSGPQGEGRPPRRPNRAGFPYKLLTVLLLVLLWPIGMILLWQRRLKWSGLMKAFTSAITLMLCVLLLGTALTVQTHNPRITAIQNSVIGAADSALDAITDFSVKMGERAELSVEALHDIFEVYEDQALMKAADFIDWGVSKAQLVRASFSSGDKADTGDLEREPAEEIEPTPTPGATEAAEAAPSREPGTGAEEAAPGEGNSAGTGKPAVTSAPAAELFVSVEDEELPVYIPASAPGLSNGIALSAGTLLRSGIFQAGVVITERTPEPTPEATPEVLDFAVKPAGEAIVYFNAGSGKYYHMHSSCGSMKTAKEYRLAETVNYPQEPCSSCNPPDKSLLNEEYIVWVDEDGLAHLSDECAAFRGEWSLESAAAAIESGRKGCPDCLADLYLDAIKAGKPVTLTGGLRAEPTAAPEESASPEESAEPEASAGPEESTEPEASTEPVASAAPDASTEPDTSAEPGASEEAGASTASTASASATKAPIVVTPRTTLKPVPEVMVYHTSNGTYYHTNDHCSGMTGGKPYTLSESVAAGFKQCPVCGAPPEDASSDSTLTLWLDEQNICHVSDECKSFLGEYKLITRDEALAQHLAGCSRCGGADYVIQNTVMDSYAPNSATATPAPTPETTPEAGESAAPEASDEAA